MTRLLRLLAVVALVLAGSQLLTAPTGATQLADPVVLDTSAASVPYGKQLVLTATVAAPQPDARVDFYAKAVGTAAKLLGSATTGGDGKAKLALPVTRTATYYAVLVVGGVATAESVPVAAVVAPTLKLTAAQVIGPVYHFSANVAPAADGIPIVLQRLVGKKWTKIEKSLTRGGELTFTATLPTDVASKWRLFVRGSKKYGESTSKTVTVVEPSRLTAR